MRVSIAATDIEVQACMAIRNRVFLIEQKVPAAREYDGLDDDAIHYLVWLDGKIVATARLRVVEHIACIERVAVVPEARRKGVAMGLMQQIIEDCRGEDGITESTLSSQTYITGLYEKLGFKETGPIYEDAGLPHVKMELTF